ncbi:MAG TPA: PAS domain S-box protein [Candidatus Omnitrophota bacterium]|nr:PAS domain S-box protein [Candidatus Omnitrophota bacterium]HPT38893.1 PAS domain S-box protein [Candidatus Omnitrophota bacterium]
MKDIFSKLIEDAAVLVLYLDQNGNIVLCNKKTQGTVGLNSAEIVGKNWLSILFKNDDNTIKREMFKAVLDDALTYRRTKDFECHLKSSQGDSRLISWNVTPILDKHERIQGSLLLGHDITESQEGKNSLKNIDDSLKNIISSIDEYALYVINLDSLITYFGMGCEKMFGYSKPEIIFKHASILHSSNKAVLELEAILKHVHQFGKYESEINLLTNAGSTIPVRLTVNNFLDAQGKLTGYVFIAKDITRTKKLEYQIFQAEKLAALGQLSAGIAHEINNPLFVISGRLVMLKGEKLASKFAETIDLIDSQVNRIRKLVDRVLKFARKSALTLEPVDINEIIELALPLALYNNLPSVEVKIEKIFEKNIPKISGDLDQLQEVFLNIIINAYQSMPEGGVIKITTSNFQNRYALIQITDTGMGIPETNLKNIFMPFFSTKGQGTGLGLSICHNIIKNHNGSIELESRINQGTTFTVKLPFA